MKFMLIPILITTIACHNEEKSNTSLLEQNQKYWKVLEGLNLETKGVSTTLQSKLNKEFKIYGFMVPLQYDSSAISEFLLLPYPMSCMHLPPPKNNQMIVAKMSKDEKAKYTWGPIWVTGMLSMTPDDKEEDLPAFNMVVKKIEPYEDTDGSLQRHITGPTE